MPYNEEAYEDTIMELFRDALGYETCDGRTIDRDFKDPLFPNELEECLSRINPNVPSQAIFEAAKKIRDMDIGDTIQKNKRFTEYLQDGITVEYFDGKETRHTLIHLIDYANPDNNLFQAINQWTVVEKDNRRPDIVIFVNGLPLVVIELKSPSREDTDVSEAYRQIKNYLQDIPSLFIYNMFCVISDFATSKAGTITSEEDRFVEWKSIDGIYAHSKHVSYNVLFEGMFDKSRFLDIIKNFIVFSGDSVKILAAYHQYFAVKKAIESTKKATLTDGKGGVFWHTQGSGKSLSMVFYAKLLQSTLDCPTIVIITDRNDLDDQLFNQFTKCQTFLRQKPIQAKDRKDLIKLLEGRKTNGIFFTTMQKFQENETPLSERKNIIVITDEAHRSQYGLTERVSRDGKISVGMARMMRNNLPNATYIGFTGTPISSKDKMTTEIFGDYVDIYDMTQAVDDGATKPIYYESRVNRIWLDNELLDKIDEEYEKLAMDADPYVLEKHKSELARMSSILGAPDVIDNLCLDIVEHYEDNRENELSGKALIVAYSRPIAISIYKKILEIRPNWNEKIKVVMTSSNNDPEDWKEIVGNKNYKETLAKKFKDDDDPMKIAIVVDMWLTGFDVPSLATMYVYKPMLGHNLMQAIARVNRVFKNKEGGLIVDYVGIARALKEAMNDYTDRDKKRYGEMDISQTALMTFKEKLEICKDIFYKCDYSKFATGSNMDRANAIDAGASFLSDVNRKDDKETFIREGLMMRQSLSLCRSLVNQEERMNAAYFEAVRTILIRLESKEKLSLHEINARINEMLEHAIQSNGVISIFSDFGKEQNLFDKKYLNEIAKMKEKNLALELIKKIISDQIRVYMRTNLVRSEKFSEKLMRTMDSYMKGNITNEVAISELLKMAKEIGESSKVGEELGLTDEELVFYDALTKPEAIMDFYTDERLIELTKELTKNLRKNMTIDWHKKDKVRARMRHDIKVLLGKYNYPPKDREDALKIVLAQCEHWAENAEIIE